MYFICEEQHLKSSVHQHQDNICSVESWSDSSRHVEIFFIIFYLMDTNKKHLIKHDLQGNIHLYSSDKNRKYVQHSSSSSSVQVQVLVTWQSVCLSPQNRITSFKNWSDAKINSTCSRQANQLSELVSIITQEFEHSQEAAAAPQDNRQMFS